MHGITFKHENLKRIVRTILIGEIVILFLLIYMTYNNSDGSYSKETNMILMYPKDNSISRQFYVASHEIGHYLYFQKMTPDERAEYKKLFDDTNEFISPYASTNEFEDFAEEFAGRISFTYSGDDIWWTSDMNKINFFNNIVEKYVYDDNNMIYFDSNYKDGNYIRVW